MRAEHESEVNVLKEEKQDLLMKYHATAAKMRQHERRCVELSEEREEMQAQVVALQVRSPMTRLWCGASGKPYTRQEI